MIIEIFSSGPLETTISLIGCEKSKEAAFIDAPLNCLNWAYQMLEKYQLKAKMLLLTHSHWDHFGDAAELKKNLGCAIYIHPQDKKNLECPGSDSIPLFCMIRSVEIDHLIFDGQILKIGEIEITVLHTPGHTPGGVCYWIKKENILFSGDTLFKGTIGNLSLPTACPEKMPVTLKKLAQLPLNTLVVPGHGQQTTIEEEQWLRDFSMNS